MCFISFNNIAEPTKRPKARFSKNRHQALCMWGHTCMQTQNGSSTLMFPCPASICVQSYILLVHMVGAQWLGFFKMLPYCWIYSWRISVSEPSKNLRKIQKTTWVWDIMLQGNNLPTLTALPQVWRMEQHTAVLPQEQTRKQLVTQSHSASQPSPSSCGTDPAAALELIQFVSPGKLASSQLLPTHSLLTCAGGVAVALQRQLPALPCSSGQVPCNTLLTCGGTLNGP